MKAKDELAALRAELEALRAEVALLRAQAALPYVPAPAIANPYGFWRCQTCGCWVAGSSHVCWRVATAGINDYGLWNGSTFNEGALLTNLSAGD